MEMYQVRYFLALCETLNFTRAAEQCHVAQPSLTKAIQRLEDEVGGPLFRRERSHTHLTDLGQLMRPHLEAVYAASEAARAEAEGFLKMDRAPLKLGVMCTIGPRRLIHFFQRLRDEIPMLEVVLREAPGQKLVDMMMAGDIDVAIIGLPELPERFDARPLFSERYVVAFHEGHRFEALNTVPLAELDGEDYLRRTNCEYPIHFKATGLPACCQVKVRYETEREDWIQAMIVARMGCAVVPEFLPIIPGIATRVIVEPELSRQIKLVTVAGRRFSPVVRVFVNAAVRYDWVNQP